MQATFAPTTTFPDVASGRPDYAAIVALATRGTIRGYANGSYGPDDGVQRAQMAALIARATPAGPGTPADHADAARLPRGRDLGLRGLGQQLHRPGRHRPQPLAQRGHAAALRRGLRLHRRGLRRTGGASPCYGPTDPVSYAQTIAFITRAMIAKGYWVAQPNAPLPYGGVPGVLATEVRTFHFYTGGVSPRRRATGTPGRRAAGSPMALWAALNSYWGTDGNLPDGRPAGGFAL